MITILQWLQNGGVSGNGDGAEAAHGQPRTDAGGNGWRCGGNDVARLTHAETRGQKFALRWWVVISILSGMLWFGAVRSPIK